MSRHTSRFQEIYHAHYASLFRYLDRLSGDPDLAADLVQEAFVRLYRRRELPDRPDLWLVTVALNLFRNEHAGRQRRARLQLVRSEEIAPEASPSPVEAAASAERGERVRRALDLLSDRDRELLLLRAEGYAYRDLAETLGLHEPSIGTLLARARSAFRAAFSEGAAP